MKFKESPQVMAITGGKGGTGKTMVAVNLAYIFAKNNYRVQYIDCDVDAPNAAILLNAELKPAKVVESFIPAFNDNCVSCGACQKACVPHALLNIQDKKPLLFPEICTGCEACRLVCDYNAVDADNKIIGQILTGSKYNIDLVVGELSIGEPKSADVVREVKQFALDEQKKKKYDICIIDTAPGAHCDIIHALDNSDIIISVTEPTPFGYHDLQRILELITYLPNQPKSYIIVNRSDLTDQKMPFVELASEYNSSILEEIPMSREVQISYSEGVPVLEKFPEAKIKPQFQNILNKLEATMT